MTPLLTKEDDPIETPPPPKMNAVLLTFFLRLSSHVMLCKNRERSEWICFKATSLNLTGFTSYQSSLSAMKKFVSSDIGLMSKLIARL